MNRMKVVFFIIIISLLYSNPIIAVDNRGVFGLRQIIEMAVEKNIELQVAELNLEDARLNYKKEQLNNLLTNSRLLALQSKLDKAEAEEEYKNIKDKVILSVIERYIDIISTNQQLITAQKELELEAKRVEEVKAEVEVGDKNSLELFEQENIYLAAKNSLEKIKDDLAQKLQELKQNISITGDAEIKIIDLIKPEIYLVSEEDILATAIRNNISLELRKQQVILAENDLKKAKLVGTADLDLREKEIALEKTRLELTKERQNIENDLQNKYYLQKQSIKNMDMAKKAVTQAEEHYKIIKEQNNAGLISKNDLLSSELSLYEAQNEYTESIINYYINMLQLQKAMGLELEVDIKNENSRN